MTRCIVAGTDGSPTARHAVMQAAEMARALGARLHLVNAYNPVGPEASRRVDAAEAAMFGFRDPAQLDDIDPRKDATALVADLATELEGRGADITTEVRPGPAADVLIRTAEEEQADLIVVGSRGMSGARRLLGSVPNTVSHHAPCDVLIVKTS